MYEPQTLVNDAEHYGISVTAVADLKPGDWYYQVIMVHHYTPQENDGRHNLYMTVLDENGERVVGAKVAVLNHGNNQTTYVTCDKPISEPAGNCQLNMRTAIRHASRPGVLRLEHRGPRAGQRAVSDEARVHQTRTARFLRPCRRPEIGRAHV